MKKVLIIVAVVVVVASVMVSCKTHEKCPAYSQNVDIQTEIAS